MIVPVDGALSEASGTGPVLVETVFAYRPVHVCLVVRDWLCLHAKLQLDVVCCQQQQNIQDKALEKRTNKQTDELNNKGINNEFTEQDANFSRINPKRHLRAGSSDAPEFQCMQLNKISIIKKNFHENWALVLCMVTIAL